MSAYSQTDETISKVIRNSYEILQFRPIFKDYDENRSEHQELLDVIVHNNEFDQLKNNCYHKQTTENLKTDYGRVFDQIGEVALNLHRNCDDKKEVAKLSKHIQKLDMSHSYLKEFVFNSDDMAHSLKAKKALNAVSAKDFLSCKSRLKKAIDKYLNNAA